MDNKKQSSRKTLNPKPQESKTQANKKTKTNNNVKKCAILINWIQSNANYKVLQKITNPKLQVIFNKECAICIGTKSFFTDHCKEWNKIEYIPLQEAISKYAVNNIKTKQPVSHNNNNKSSSSSFQKRKQPIRYSQRTQERGNENKSDDDEDDDDDDAWMEENDDVGSSRKRGTRKQPVRQQQQQKKQQQQNKKRKAVSSSDDENEESDEETESDQDEKEEEIESDGDDDVNKPKCHEFYYESYYLDIHFDKGLSGKIQANNNNNSSSSVVLPTVLSSSSSSSSIVQQEKPQQQALSSVKQEQQEQNSSVLAPILSSLSSSSSSSTTVTRKPAVRKPKTVTELVIRRLTRIFIVNHPVLMPHQAAFMKLEENRDVNLPNQNPTLISYVVGTGKTRNCVYYYSQHVPANNIMVVAPVSMIIPWCEEIAAMPQQPNTISVWEIIGNEEFYKQAGNNPGLLKNKNLIVDEAHHCYLSMTPRMQYMLTSFKQANWKLYLTGTPLMNDVYAELPNFLIAMECPLELIEESRTFNPVKKYQDHPDFLLRLYHALKGRIAYYDPETCDPEGFLEYFPKKEKKIVYIQMSYTQKLAYLKNDLTQQEVLVLGDTRIGNALNNTYNATTRRICNALSKQDAPTLKDEDQLIAPKFDFAEVLISSEKKFPALIHSFFVEAGLRLCTKRLQKNLPHLKIEGMDGSTPVPERARLINKLNTRLNKRSGLDVFNFSQVGGEGQNLLRARLLIKMGTAYNIPKETQEDGRIIRYKSHYDLPVEERNLCIYYLIAVFDKPDDFNEANGDLYIPWKGNDVEECIKLFKYYKYGEGILSDEHKPLISKREQAYQARCGKGSPEYELAQSEYIKEREAKRAPLSFDLIKEMDMHIQSNKLQTIEQKILKDKANKHQQMQPIMCVLACASMLGKIPEKIARNFSELTKTTSSAAESLLSLAHATKTTTSTKKVSNLKPLNLNNNNNNNKLIILSRTAN